MQHGTGNTCTSSLFKTSNVFDKKPYWLLCANFYSTFMIKHNADDNKMGFKASTSGTVT